MQKRTRTTLFLSSLATAVVALTLAACGGGGSDSSPVSDLAGFMPADTAIYVQGSLHPDSDVQTKTDDIARKLTGSTLGEQLQGALASSDNDVDYKTDIEPWLGDNAAFAGGAEVFDSGIVASGGVAPGTTGVDSGDSEAFSAVVETSDADAAKSFLEEQSKPGGEGEYEGYSYSTMQEDDAVAGIVDDNFVAASDLAGFKAMVDASKGDSLEGSEGFSAVADKVSDGSLVNIYLGSAATTGASPDMDYSGVYKAFGIDPEKAGAMFSLVPEENEISIRGYTADQPDITPGDASGLIASFPANTVFAMGSGDIGENATKTIETLDKDGIPGMLKPGQLGQSLDQITEQGIDVRSLIENLNDLGLFVQGDSPQRLGGALVLTSSDLSSVRSSFKAITGLIRLAGDNSVKPLGGGMLGLRVMTPDLPGRPVVFAVGEDRIVIAIGMPSARQALAGSGEDLGSTENFNAAKDSIDGALAMYADPAALSTLIGSSGAVDSGTAQFNEILGKFRFMAAGSGSEEGSAEINLGLKE